MARNKTLKATLVIDADVSKASKAVADIKNAASKGINTPEERRSYGRKVDTAIKDTSASAAKTTALGQAEAKRAAAIQAELLTLLKRELPTRSRDAKGRFVKGELSGQEIASIIATALRQANLGKQFNAKAGLSDSMRDNAYAQKAMQFAYAPPSNDPSQRRFQEQAREILSAVAAQEELSDKVRTTINHVENLAGDYRDAADSAQALNVGATKLNTILANLTKEQKAFNEAMERGVALSKEFFEGAETKAKNVAKSAAQLAKSFEKLDASELTTALKKVDAAMGPLDIKVQNLQRKLANVQNNPQETAKAAERIKELNALETQRNNLINARNAILARQAKMQGERNAVDSLLKPYQPNAGQTQTMADSRMVRAGYDDKMHDLNRRITKTGKIDDAIYNQSRADLDSSYRAVRGVQNQLGQELDAGIYTGSDLVDAKKAYERMEALTKAHLEKMEDLERAYEKQKTHGSLLNKNLDQDRARNAEQAKENAAYLKMINELAEAKKKAESFGKSNSFDARRAKKAYLDLQSESLNPLSDLLDGKAGTAPIRAEAMRAYGLDPEITAPEFRRAYNRRTNEARVAYLASKAKNFYEIAGAKLKGGFKSQGFRDFQGRFGYGLGMLGVGLGAGGFGYAATNLIKGTAGAYIDRTSTEAGLSGLTNTYTKFNDFNQKPVSAATNFSLSVNSAKALYGRLRDASKETLVTPQELAESFMSGAPALRNKGFSEDQALKLTSRIVAMGRAMNLPSAAIQSDIRDFARGSVTRNSQVLQALGLSTTGLKEATAKGPESAMAYFNERVAGFEPAFKKLREELPGQINEMRIELEKAAQDIGMYATPNIIKGIQTIRKELVSFGESGGFEKLGTQLGQLVNGVATMFQTAAPLIMTATSSMESAIVTTLGGALAFVTLQSLAAANPILAFGAAIVSFTALAIMQKDRLMRESVQSDWEAGNKSVEIFGSKSKTTAGEMLVGVNQLQSINADRIAKGQKPLSPKEYSKQYLELKNKYPAIEKVSGFTDGAKGEGDASASQPGWWQGWQGLARTFGLEPRQFDRAAAKDALTQAESFFEKDIPVDPETKKYYEDNYQKALDMAKENLVNDIFGFVNQSSAGNISPKNPNYVAAKAKFNALKSMGVTPQAFTDQDAIIEALKNPKTTAEILSQKAVVAAGKNADDRLSGAAKAQKAAEKKARAAGGSEEDVRAAGAEAYRMYGTTSAPGASPEDAGKASKQTSALEAKIAQLQYAANQADRYVQRTSDFAISGGGYLKLNALGKSMDAGIAVARAEYELGMANAKENELGPYEDQRLQTQLQQAITNVTNAYEDQRRQMELNIEQQKMQNKLLSDSNEIKRKELQYAEKEFQVSKIDKDDIQGGYAARMGLLQDKYGLTRMRYASSMTQISESDRIRRLEYAEASKSTMDAVSNAALDDGMSSTGMSNSAPGGAFTLGNQFGNTQTSGFGPRRRPSTFGGKQGSKNHGGIDYGVPTGTKIRAQADGKVIFAGNKGGYGYYLQIDHGPVVTAYGHLSKIFVSVGDIVTKGQVVALSGGGKNDKGRGNSSGAHVHFETRINGKTVNPASVYGKEFTSSGFKSSGTTFTKPLSMAASGVSYGLWDEDVRLQRDQAMLEGPRTDMQTLRQSAFSEGARMAGETAARSTLEMGKRGARYDVLNGDYESNAQRQRAIQLFDAQQRFDLLKESTDRRARDYSTIVGDRAARIFEMEANLGSGGVSMLADKRKIDELKRLNATEPQKAFDALFNTLNNANNALKDFTRYIAKANEIEKARNDRDALGIEQAITAGTRGYDKSMSRLGGSGRIDAGFFSTDSIRSTYSESGAAAQESAQSQLDMRIANDKATRAIVLGRNGKPEVMSLYEKNLKRDPQYYNKIRQANISRIQGNTLSAAGKDRLLGNPRLSGLISGGIGSLGSLDAYGLLSNPEGRLDAIKGLVSPLTSIGADDKNSALSMLAAGAFASDASMFGNPAFNKYLKATGMSAVGGIAVPTKFGYDRKRMMADAASGAAAQFGGDIAGNFIGTSLFRNTDPGAIGLGTSMGSTLGSMAGSGLLGTGGAALFAPLGPWAPVVGAVLGGMLGGMFGGKKKDPREQQEKENRKQFQRRIEDILNNIDKSLGPQSDYYRAIRGDLLYGAASSYYSGRAYSRIGIGYNTGGR